MKLKSKKLVCAYCGRDIDFTADGHLVHDDGNAYSFECVKCGWLGAAPPAKDICPDCGSKLIRGHFAYPDLTNEEWEKL